jgi:hypothetical protein
VTGQASANLHRVAVQVRAMPRRSLIDIAKGAKAVAAQAGSAAGSPLKGKKKRGMRLRAIDTIHDTGDGATLRVQGVNPAGWVWVNSGTRPHQIRRRKRGPLSKVFVHHPGTSGRGAWRGVVARIQTSVIPPVLVAQVKAAVRG